MRNHDSTSSSWRFNRVGSGIIPCLIAILLASRGVSAAGEMFDMHAIRDPGTLEVEVLQDWHTVQGPIATRQKLVTINVGEMWAGQDYRVPVRMVVPADRKAKGLHLTGASTPARLKMDAKPSFKC